MAKIPQNIFKKPKLELEEEEAPPLQVVRVGATTRRGRNVMSPLILVNCGAKRLMCSFLVKLFMCHNLNHVLNVGSKSPKSLRVDGYVPYLKHDVVKHINPLMLHECVKQVLLMG
jgi:hypothetical protein